MNAFSGCFSEHNRSHDPKPFHHHHPSHGEQSCCWVIVSGRCSSLLTLIALPSRHRKESGGSESSAYAFFSISCDSCECSVCLFSSLVIDFWVGEKHVERLRTSLQSFYPWSGDRLRVTNLMWRNRESWWPDRDLFKVNQFDQIPISFTIHFSSTFRFSPLSISQLSEWRCDGSGFMGQWCDVMQALKKCKSYLSPPPLSPFTSFFWLYTFSAVNEVYPRIASSLLTPYFPFVYTQTGRISQWHSLSFLLHHSFACILDVFGMGWKPEQGRKYKKAIHFLATLPEATFVTVWWCLIVYPFPNLCIWLSNLFSTLVSGSWNSRANDCSSWNVDQATLASVINLLSIINESSPQSPPLFFLRLSSISIPTPFHQLARVLSQSNESKLDLSNPFSFTLACPSFAPTFHSFLCSFHCNPNLISVVKRRNCLQKVWNEFGWRERSQERRRSLQSEIFQRVSCPSSPFTILIIQYKLLLPHPLNILSIFLLTNMRKWFGHHIPATLSPYSFLPFIWSRNWIWWTGNGNLTWWCPSPERIGSPLSR